MMFSLKQTEFLNDIQMRFGFRELKQVIKSLAVDMLYSKVLDLTDSNILYATVIYPVF
jgi:hypothetical protein